METRERIGVPHRTVEQTDGSNTSLQAARDVQPEAHNKRHAVWLYIFGEGERGATADECNAALNVPHACTIRITELRRLGRIERTGRTRKTRQGSNADVYVALYPSHWKDKRKNWPAPKQTERQKNPPSKKLKLATKALEDIERRGRTGGLFAGPEIQDIATQALRTIK